jgi:hypothetical protein
LCVACAHISAARAQPEQPPPAQPSPAPADVAVEQARVHLKRATELYEAGEFKLALTEFERAYFAAPNYRILYNIGQMNLQLNNYAAALAAFEKYLTDGGEDIESDRRTSVLASLPTLRARTGTLSVTSNVTGAVVRIDGVVVGVTPLAGVRLDAGVHNVILTKDGRSTSEIVTVGGDDSHVALEVEMKLPEPPAPQPVPAPIVRPDPKPDGEPQDQGVGAGVWVSWTITGALTVAAIGTGIAALTAQNEHEETLARLTSAAELEASHDKAMSLSIATDVLIGAAAVSGAVSLILTLTDVTSDKTKVDARLGPNGGTLRVSF